MGKISNFINGVKKEIERVRWTNKKDMVRYSVTTIIFIIFFALFFFVVDLLFSFIKSIVG